MLLLRAKRTFLLSFGWRRSASKSKSSLYYFSLPKNWELYNWVRAVFTELSDLFTYVYLLENSNIFDEIFRVGELPIVDNELLDSGDELANCFRYLKRFEIAVFVPDWVGFSVVSFAAWECNNLHSSLTQYSLSGSGVGEDFSSISWTFFPR